MSTSQPALIMLPGLCCDAWFFRLQAQAFARCRDGSPRHVIVPEWISHVDVRDGTGALQRVAGRLATAWHEAGLDGAIVVGHSLGGIVATLACSAGRFTPHSLLLLDASVPTPPERRPFLAEMSARMLACVDPDPELQCGRVGSLMREYVLDHLVSPHDDRDTIDQIIDRMRSADPHRCGLLLQSCAIIDLSTALRRVPNRVAAIAADPPRLPVELFRAIRPTAEVMGIPHVGHFVQLLAAPTVNAAIACLMDDAPLRGGGLMPISGAGAAASA